jgi:hypothetical protein
MSRARDLANVTRTYLPLSGGTIVEPVATDVPLIIRGATSQSADVLKLQNSSSTDLMRVDSVGRMLIPNTPYVRLAVASNVAGTGGNQKITSFTIYDNVGSCWNSGNARFTCPVTGVYQVSISGIKYPQAGAMHIDIYKNGVNQGDGRTRAEEASGYNQFGSSQLMPASANDYLEWYWFGDGGYHAGHGYWSIRLVG